MSKKQRIKCIDCGKELSKNAVRNRTVRCRHCSLIERFKDPTNHPMYKHGEHTKLHFCIKCNTPISVETYLIGKQMCGKCSCIGRIVTEEAKEHMRTAS